MLLNINIPRLTYFLDLSVKIENFLDRSFWPVIPEQNPP